MSDLGEGDERAGEWVLGWWLGEGCVCWSVDVIWKMLGCGQGWQGDRD